MSGAGTTPGAQRPVALALILPVQLAAMVVVGAGVGLVAALVSVVVFQVLLDGF